MMSLETARTWVIRVLAAGIAAGTAWAFYSSYHGLLRWALEHEVPPPLCYGFPVMIDMFVLYGEGRLFIAAIDGPDLDPLRVRLWYWTMAATGLIVSVAGNVGHVQAASLSVRLTAALPPIVAAAGLGAGLGLVKRAASKTATGSPAPSGMAPVRSSPAPRRKSPRPPAPRPASEDQAALELFTSATAAGQELTPRKAAALAQSSGLKSITRYKAGLILGQITSTTPDGAAPAGQPESNGHLAGQSAAG